MPPYTFFEYLVTRVTDILSIDGVDEDYSIMVAFYYFLSTCLAAQHRPHHPETTRDPAVPMSPALCRIEALRTLSKIRSYSD